MSLRGESERASERDETTVTTPHPGPTSPSNPRTSNPLQYLILKVPLSDCLDILPRRTGMIRHTVRQAFLCPSLVKSIELRLDTRSIFGPLPSFSLSVWPRKCCINALDSDCVWSAGSHCIDFFCTDVQYFTAEGQKSEMKMLTKTYFFIPSAFSTNEPKTFPGLLVATRCSASPPCVRMFVCVCVECAFDEDMSASFSSSSVQSLYEINFNVKKCVFDEGSSLIYQLIK